jgi:CO/xanthine dehydrogenase Mo-binding subunit
VRADARRRARVAHTTAGQSWPEPSPYDAFLLDRKVRYRRRPRRARRGRNAAIAAAALEKIDVDYEVLPAVFEPKRRSLPGAPCCTTKTDSDRHLRPAAQSARRRWNSMSAMSTRH